MSSASSLLPEDLECIITIIELVCADVAHETVLYYKQTAKLNIKNLMLLL